MTMMYLSEEEWIFSQEISIKETYGRPWVWKCVRSWAGIKAFTDGTVIKGTFNLPEEKNKKTNNKKKTPDIKADQFVVQIWAEVVFLCFLSKENLAVTETETLKLRHTFQDKYTAVGF